MIRVAAAAACTAACVAWLCSTPALAAEGGDEAPSLKIGGRVIAGHLSESALDASGAPGTWTGQLLVPSARVEVETTFERLRAVVEGDWEGKPKLKDAFVRLKMGKGFAVRVGQFKMPVSAIETESLLDLPVARRGLMHEVLASRMQLGWRRPGLQVEWAGSLVVPLKVRAGAWQGTGADGEPQPGPAAALFGHNLAIRGSAELGPVEAGAWYESRATELAIGQGWDRHGAAGLDVTFATLRGFRGWAEAALGSSWLDDNAFDERSAFFVAGRLIAAWRAGGATKGEGYLEPFVLFGAVDPDAEIRDDIVWELGAGLNLGQWERWRFQVVFDIHRLGRNVPASLAFGGDPLDDRLSLQMQVAARL